MRILIFLVLCTSAGAQDSSVTTSVTYLAAGSIYAGSGRNSGIGDSSKAVVVREGAVIVHLDFVAVSSKSSVWTPRPGGGKVLVGDTVVVSIPITNREPKRDAVVIESKDSTTRVPAPAAPYSRKKAPPRPPVELSGRAGLQWFSTTFQDAGLNLLQSGLVVSLRGTLRDLPLRFTLYGTARDMSRGTTPLFSNRSAATSRLYRMTLEYDDGDNAAWLGRFLIPFAPTTGTIDGAGFARRFGRFQVGILGGLAPTLRLQKSDFSRKKLAFFAAANELLPLTRASVTYSKTWFHDASDREVVSLNVSSYGLGGFSLYAAADLDIRVPSHGVHEVDPALSLFMLNASVRIMDMLSASIGADASRFVLPFSNAQRMPDSLVDHSLRKGLHSSLTVSLPSNMTFTASYSPRSSSEGFGNEFTQVSSFSVYDAFRSGVGLRASFQVTSASTTKGTGFGLSAFRTFGGVDITVRGYKYRYRMTQTTEQISAWTAGFDFLLPLLSRLSAAVSIDRGAGFGPPSTSMFAELGYRF